MIPPVEVLQSPETEVATLVGQALTLLRQAWVIAVDEAGPGVGFLLQRVVGFVETAHRELARAAAVRARVVRRTVTEVQHG